MKIIRIKDYYGKIQSVPVSDELYEEWKAMNREEDRIRKREKYHRDYTDLGSDCENAAADLVSGMDAILDDFIREEDNQRLYDAISKLGPIQRRRVLMYMDCMSYTEVARHEGVTVVAVYQNLMGAFKRLRMMLEE